MCRQVRSLHLGRDRDLSAYAWYSFCLPLSFATAKHPRLLRDPCRPSGMIGRGSVHHWQSNEFLPCEERCSTMYATAILLARQHPIYHMSLHDFKQPVERSTSRVFRCQMAQNDFPGSPFASIIRFSPPGPRLV